MQKNLSTVDETTQLTVYYDGACPLCRKEIGWYQKQRGAEQIQWRDVSRSPDDNVAADLCTADALRRFHVRKTDGTLVSGAAAFAELWLRLPRFKLFGALSKLPFISQFAELMYRLFLKIRPFVQRRFKSG